MIVNEEYVEKRLTSQLNIAHKSYGKAQNPQPDRPDFLREIELGLYLDGETQAEVAKEFGVAQQTISSNFRGFDLSKDSSRRIDSRRQSAQSTALDKLMDTLGLLTVDKMKNCKATDLSSIASNMSKVVDKMDKREGNTNNILIIHAPKMKDEKEFETISI